VDEGRHTHCLNIVNQLFLFARFGKESLDFPAFNVHPVKRLDFVVPQWAFTQDIL